MKKEFPPLNRPEEVALRRAAHAWGLAALEMLILGELVRGLENKEIVCTIGRALKTVERYVSRLLIKSRSNTRAMLAARFWAEFGWPGTPASTAPLATR